MLALTGAILSAPVTIRNTMTNPETMTMKLANSIGETAYFFCRVDNWAGVTDVNGTELVGSAHACSEKSQTTGGQASGYCSDPNTMVFEVADEESFEFIFPVDPGLTAGKCWLQPKAANAKEPTQGGPHGSYMQSVAEFTLGLDISGVVDISSVDGYSHAMTLTYQPAGSDTPTIQNSCVMKTAPLEHMELLDYDTLGFTTVMADKYINNGAATCDTVCHDRSDDDFSDPGKTKCLSDDCLRACPSNVVNRYSGAHACRTFYANASNYHPYIDWLRSDGESCEAYGWAMDELACSNNAGVPPEMCGFRADGIGPEDWPDIDDAAVKSYLDEYRDNSAATPSCGAWPSSSKGWSDPEAMGIEGALEGDWSEHYGCLEYEVSADKKVKADIDGSQGGVVTFTFALPSIFKDLPAAPPPSPPPPESPAVDCNANKVCADYGGSTGCYYEPACGDTINVGCGVCDPKCRGCCNYEGDGCPAECTSGCGGC